MSAVSADL